MKSSRRCSFVLAIATTLLAAGCVYEDSGPATNIPAPPWQSGAYEEGWHKVEADRDYLSARGAGETAQFKVTANELSNHAVSLSRDSADRRVFRGIAWGSGLRGSTSIELRAEGKKVEGFRDAQPIDVELTKEGDATKVSGNYGGGYVHFKMRKDDGVACAYRDDSVSEEETVSCSTLRHSMTMPTSMAALPEADQAAMLLVAMFQ